MIKISQHTKPVESKLSFKDLEKLMIQLEARSQLLAQSVGLVKVQRYEY